MQCLAFIETITVPKDQLCTARFRRFVASFFIIIDPAVTVPEFLSVPAAMI